MRRVISMTDHEPRKKIIGHPCKGMIHTMLFDNWDNRNKSITTKIQNGF